MSYEIAKSLAHISQPTSLAIILLTIGLLFLSLGKRRRLANVLCWTAVLYLYVAGLSPLGNVLISPLEERFQAHVQGSAAEPSGIIILGGFENGWVSAGRGHLAVNEAAERLTEGVLLARRYPNAKLVFSGGVAAVWTEGASAAQPVLEFLKAVGIDPNRIILEGNARNTYENAVLTKKLVNPKPNETWLLVTSAYHMPRSVGIFRKAGFPVQPYPVDYRTRDRRDRMRFFERFTNGLKRVDTAANEYMGLLAYYLLGRTDALFPSPKN